MWHQLPVILHVLFILKKLLQCCSLRSLWPSLGNRVSLPTQHYWLCLQWGVSAGWGRWEGYAVKQATTSLFSSWWTVTAVFMITTLRVLSHTLLCVGLLWLGAIGTEFVSSPLQVGTRRICVFFLSPPPPLHGVKMTLHLLYRKACERSSSLFFLSCGPVNEAMSDRKWRGVCGA